MIRLRSRVRTELQLLVFSEQCRDLSGTRDTELFQSESISRRDKKNLNTQQRRTMDTSANYLKKNKNRLIITLALSYNLIKEI